MKIEKFTQEVVQWHWRGNEVLNEGENSSMRFMARQNKEEK